MLNITNEKQLKKLFNIDGRAIIEGLEPKKGIKKDIYTGSDFSKEIEVKDYKLTKKEIIEIHLLLEEYEKLCNKARKSIESRKQYINILHKAFMELSELEKYLVSERLVYKNLWKNVSLGCGYSERQARKILHKAIEKIIKYYNSYDKIENQF